MSDSNVTVCIVRYYSEPVYIVRDSKAVYIVRDLKAVYIVRGDSVFI